MTDIESIFLVVLAAYVVQSTLFVLGVLQAQYRRNSRVEPSVSVVVAARNEEQKIGACLESLARLEYPKDKLEVIVVDDNSTDKTPGVIEDFSRTYPFICFLEARQFIDHLRGKSNAIAQGIDASHGSLIMMTDADCVVPPTWIRSTVQYFEERTGVVSGLTLLKVNRWFEGMQSLDWAYILAIASAAMALRAPLSCIGNNFSFRRKAYDEVGGYRGIRFSVTEDYALFKAITSSGAWDYKFPIEKETLVFSTPCPSWKELYRQKRRWGVGGKDMRPLGLLLMVIAFSMNLLLLGAPFLAIRFPLLVTGGAVKILSDLFVVASPLRLTGTLSQLRHFIHFEIYCILSVVALPFAVFLGGDVVWKGRKY